MTRPDVVIAVVFDVVAAAQLACRLSRSNGALPPTTDPLPTGATS